jgi:TetR/AcrR family transcriptional regulator
MKAGKINPVDPRHLISRSGRPRSIMPISMSRFRSFSARTAVPRGRFEDAARYLETLFLEGLRPNEKAVAG